MARLLAAVCLCALASYAAAAVGGGGPNLDRPTTYTQLKGVKGQWTISMKATKGADKAVFVPQTCASPALDAPCNQPLLGAAAKDKVQITAKLTKAPLKVVDSLKAQTVVLRLCFSKPFTVDRPWRKANDAIDRDRSCSQTVAKMPLASNNTYTATWNVPKGAPKATWYAQVLVECANGTSTSYCQFDNTADVAYLGTKIIDSTPVSMTVAVAVCSAIAPTFLAAFFIKEHFLKKSV
ncbi:MAG: hypothetical protein J3K34DRAFT_525056 [Monoraphidium minutum]|nr:MAG: hypothetical protein J3K34DRAFT_525056 [Monoraphidium minutum]